MATDTAADGDRTGKPASEDARTGARLTIPPDATDEEAAAIAAAVAAYRRAVAIAMAADADTDRRGERWRFAGRLAAVHGRRARAPASAPADPWAAADRVDRF